MNRKRKLKRFLLGLFQLIAVMISIFLTILIIDQIIRIPERTARAGTSANMGIADIYRRDMNNRFSAELDGVLSIPKKYWINDENEEAPRPNRACYGETEDPEEVLQIVTQAEKVLEGQEVLFSSERDFLPGSLIRYYLDDTVLAIVWKESRIGCVFTIAEVKVAHPSQFRRFLAGNEFGSGTLMLTTEMAESVHAVVAGSGDYYAYRGLGIVVQDGVVYRNNQGIPDTCYVKRNGDLMLVRAPKFPSMEQAQKYVDEQDIRFSLSFGPALIRDGELLDIESGSVGENKQHYSRAAICQRDRLHYLYIAANSESGFYQLPTMEEFAQSISEMDCQQAYGLDGGQTATVVMDNQTVNRVNYGSQRRISDIIYFATAVPEGA